MSVSVSATTICRNFRTKAMFAREQGEDVVRATEETLHFPYCWCAGTAREIGPDDALAGPKSCSNPARPCFQPR